MRIVHYDKSRLFVEAGPSDLFVGAVVEVAAEIRLRPECLRGSALTIRTPNEAQALSDLALIVRDELRARRIDADEHPDPERKV